MKRYAIIKSNKVISVIEYENPPENPPPGFERGIISVQSDTAGPGWEYVNGTFIEPISDFSKPTVNDIKNKAIGLLNATDWSEIPSVVNTNNTPHLLNPSEFIAYRVALRKIAVNPTLDAQFPVEPESRWSEE